MKLIKNESWPLLGICQGFELISIMLGDNDIYTLSKFTTYGKKRTVNWTLDDPIHESRTFRYFTPELVEKMRTKKFADHEHTWAVSTETFENKKGLKNSMRII
jgi:gamma-glutamyl-gamma-aminobutyrate hydrolase PuuD